MMIKAKRIDNQKYNAMSYLYDRLLGESKYIPQVFSGGYGRTYSQDPFKPYQTYDVSNGIRFKVWRNHNVIGTVAITYNDGRYRITTPYHRVMTDEKPSAVFKMVNDCIIGLINGSSEDVGREWGNWRYTYDVSF